MTKREWQPWIPGTDAQVAQLPVETKLKFGTLFGAIPQLAPIFQKQGPIVVFESVNRLVRDGHIEVQIMDYGRDRYKCRYRLVGVGMNEMVTIN